MLAKTVAPSAVFSNCEMARGNGGNEVGNRDNFRRFLFRGAWVLLQTPVIMMYREEGRNGLDIWGCGEDMGDEEGNE